MFDPLLQLKTVYFEHNGIQSDPCYAPTIMGMLPTLSQLDATPIKRE
jgi:hypothetical protein